MTATPIPRTLALTAYGDMAVSQIREKPPGRKPITTRAVSADRLDDVMAAVARAIERRDQIYWVCPVVDDKESHDLVSVSARADTLAARFGPPAVGLVHGQMPAEAKDAVIAAFGAGDVPVLVATTVIEVGVNTPNATVMVVEHAERFGLAQLHQLRGRVGRGDKPATCLLLYHAGPEGLGETAKDRLAIMRESEDGFVIAEEDLRLRGAGDSLGTIQSGMPKFRFADPAGDTRLLEEVHAEADAIVREDADLETEKGAALRLLLYIFGQDDAVRRLRSG